MKKSLKLVAGDVVRRKKNDYVYKVKDILGSGGYGSVYRVFPANEDGTPHKELQYYALKTELTSANKASSRLKIEKSVMVAYGKLEPSKRDHFPEYVEHGMTANFKWVVMSLVGHSLEKLKKENFTLPTALQAGLQTLKSIYDLHNIGFLHRDIKPANFCIGCDAKAKTIYMLDFGMARLYRKPDGAHRPQRLRTKMVGTPRYCARASHLKQDLGRKDDYESWLFMFFDFLDPTKGVPWRGKSREEALEMKQRVFTDADWLPMISSVISSKFFNICTYLNGLEYNSEVNYQLVRDVLMDYARDTRITLNEPLDWIKDKSKGRVTTPSIRSTPRSTRFETTAPSMHNGSMSTENDDEPDTDRKSKRAKRKTASRMIGPD